MSYTRALAKPPTARTSIRPAPGRLSLATAGMTPGLRFVRNVRRRGVSFMLCCAKLRLCRTYCAD